MWGIFKSKSHKSVQKEHEELKNTIWDQGWKKEKENAYVRRERYIIDIDLISEANNPRIGFRKKVDRMYAICGDIGHRDQKGSNILRANRETKER